MIAFQRRRFAGPVILLLLGGLNACRHRSPEPQPSLPAATYAEGSAAPIAIDLPAARLLTVANSVPGNLERRAVVLRVVLPDSRQYEYVFSFYGSSFPTATGPVQLDGTAQIAPATAAGAVPPYYQDMASTGRLVVDQLTPRLVSGSYTGAVQAGGPVVKLTFKALPIN